MDQEKKAEFVAAKPKWETPRVETSTAFTKAALACCVDDDNVATGSNGLALPFC
jgi:hypothetical protein